MCTDFMVFWTVRSMKTRLPGDFAKYLLSSALVLRLGLFTFSLWQDATRWPDGQLRFTDVDYDVFTDAAKAMTTGVNIYEARPTYRYSPLIALFLWPGHFVSTTFRLSAPFRAVAYAFGKVVFISADIFCALLQRHIILTENATQSISTHTISWLVGAFWLFNPVTTTVSVRGNAESILGVCVLACLWCLLQNRVVLAGLLFGLCIHIKLYPVIYAPVIYLQLNEPSHPSIHLLPTRCHWCFGLATLTSLSGLTWAAYAAYGRTFLDHAYFYHFTRVDLWHNFAPHFYPIYLFEGSLALNETAYDSSLFPYNHFPVWLLEIFFCPATLQHLYALFKVLIMLPSALLVIGLSFHLWHTPSFAWFAITFAFVTFNKVCTSQYFLWWLVLLPPALAHIHTPPGCHEASKGLFGYVARTTGLTPSVVRRTTSLAGLWFAGQVCWLTVAYLHEMGGGAFWGRSLWLALWGASALFLVVNVVILKCLMRWLSTGISLTSSDKRLNHSQSPSTSMTLFKFDKHKEELEGVIRRRNVKETVDPWVT